MKNGLLAATIPFDGYARPILFNDGALIGWIVLPANAVEWLEKSGLVAGHLCTPYSNYDHPTIFAPAKLFEVPSLIARPGANPSAALLWAIEQYHARPASNLIATLGR